MSDITLDGLLNSLSDPAEDTLEKVASEQPAEPSVADELKNTLTKEASDASQIGETNMSVQTGNQIANSILAMLDNGGIDKEAGMNNNVKDEIDTMEKQHADRIVSTPRQGKTVTEVARALQERAPAGSGADSVKEENTAAVEGNSEASVSAVPSDIEKTAAVNDLMEGGYSFDDAIAMVKEASDQMEREAGDLEKAAAVSALISEGVNFEEACELVKQASTEEVVAEDHEYSELEKVAAAQELVAEDNISFDEAYELVKEASTAGK